MAVGLVPTSALNASTRVVIVQPDLAGLTKLFFLSLSLCVCLQEKLLGHLGVVLYEYLGEEYPEVLGSILGGLKVSFP